MKYEIKINETDKCNAAIEFRRKIVLEYEKWYEGKLRNLYGEPAPSKKERINIGNLRENAILTWAKLHQEKKYLEDLHLPKDIFKGFNVLDIGSGGIPSGLVFENCTIYCLDPLMDIFNELEYPFKYYEGRAKFVNSYSEKMPFPNNYFNAIISVNALDHVDDFHKSVLEIKRVLKPGGLLRMHLHYHQQTVLEPIELNDRIIQQEFKSFTGFHKLYESRSKRGSTLEDLNEKYVVWSNFKC